MNTTDVLQNYLKVTNLSHKIDSKSILQAVNLHLAQGEDSLILGASGCGKTTLLSILAGLQKPDNGEVIYDEMDLYKLTESKRDQYRGKNIGILFQNFHLIKPLTVRQNLLLAYSMSNKEPDKLHMESILERLGLNEKNKQKAGSLSVGEAQRLAVARAIIGKPKWLFCDEPTSSLDDRNAEIMMNLLIDEAKHIGTSLIIVTHDNRVRNHFKQSHIIELGKQL